MKKLLYPVTIAFLIMMFSISCTPEEEVSDFEQVGQNTPCSVDGEKSCDQLGLNILTCSNFTWSVDTDCQALGKFCSETADTPLCTESSPETCGDNVVAGIEMCDGNSKPCNEAGNFKPVGSAPCNSSCDGFDTSACTENDEAPFCGDDIKNGSDFCDGETVDCSTIGDFNSGANATCKSDCSSFDTSECEAVGGSPVCGNNTKESGESCDGNSIDCGTLGSFESGTNAPCKSDCSGYDSSTCTQIQSGPVCGNNTKESGESCDGDSVDCSTLGNYEAGINAVCKADCSGYEIATCAAPCTLDSTFINPVAGYDSYSAIKIEALINDQSATEYTDATLLEFKTRIDGADKTFEHGNVTWEKVTEGTDTFEKHSFTALGEPDQTQGIYTLISFVNININFSYFKEEGINESEFSGRTRVDTLSKITAGGKELYKECIVAFSELEEITSGTDTISVPVGKSYLCHSGNSTFGVGETMKYMTNAKLITDQNELVNIFGDISSVEELCYCFGSDNNMYDCTTGDAVQ